MRFEQETACRGTHCASAPLPATLQHLNSSHHNLNHHHQHSGLLSGLHQLHHSSLSSSHRAPLSPPPLSSQPHNLNNNNNNNNNNQQHQLAGDSSTELAPYVRAGSKESSEAGAVDQDPPAAKRPRTTAEPAAPLVPGSPARANANEHEDEGATSAAKTTVLGPGCRPAESAGPGMAYPAPTAALSRHSPFGPSATSAAVASASVPQSSHTASAASSPTGNGRLPAPVAPRPTDFSVSSLLTAASSHASMGGSSTQGSGSPPTAGPGSPAAAPETPPLQRSTGDLSPHHPTSASVAAANYFGAAALAAAGFYNPAHLQQAGSPTAAHHLSSKGILGAAHHHPHFGAQGLGPPGAYTLFIGFL